MSSFNPNISNPNISRASTQPEFVEVPSPTAENRTTEPKTVIHTAEVKIPNNATIHVYKMPEKLDEMAMHMKYLSELIESFAQFIINGCIAALTYMSFQGGLFQNFANSFGQQVLETINKVTDLAKAQMRPRAAPQPQAV